MSARRKTKPRPGQQPRAGVASDVRVAVLATSAERDEWQRRARAAGTTLSAVARAAWDALPPASR